MATRKVSKEELESVRKNILSSARTKVPQKVIDNRKPKPTLPIKPTASTMQFKDLVQEVKPLSTIQPVKVNPQVQMIKPQQDASKMQFKTLVKDVRADYKPMTEEEKQIKGLQGKLMSYNAGLLEEATSGGVTRGLKKEPEEFQKQFREAFMNRPSYTFGQTSGMLLQTIGGFKLVSGIKSIPKIAVKATEKIGNKFTRKVVEKGIQAGLTEAITESGLSALRSIGKGETFQEAVQRQKEYVPLAGIFGGAFGSAGQAYKNIKEIKQLKKLNNLDPKQLKYSDVDKFKQIDSAYSNMSKSIDTIKPTTNTIKPNALVEAIKNAPENVEPKVKIKGAKTFKTYKDTNIVNQEPVNPNVVKVSQSSSKSIDNIQRTNTIENVLPSPIIDYTKIKTIKDLPTNIDELKEYVRQVQKAQDEGKGFINLELFSEAQKRLRDRGFISNSVLGSKIVPDEIKESFRMDIPQYEQVSNKVDWENALDEVETNYKKSLNAFNSDSIRGSKGTALGEALIFKAIQNGDTEQVRDLSLTLAERLTRSGQESQAAAIFKRLDPQGMLVYGQRQIANVTDNIMKGKNSKKINETTRQIKEVVENTRNKVNETIDKTVDEVLKNVPDTMPTKMPKVSIQDDPSKMLQRGISSYVKPSTKNEKNLIREIVSDLLQEAKGVTKKGTKTIIKTPTIERLTNTYKNTKWGIKIRKKAQDYLKEEFKDSPEMLKVLDDYFNLNKRPSNKTILDKALREKLTVLAPTQMSGTKPPTNKQNIKDWVKDWYATGRESKEKFIEKLIEETGLTSDDANALRNALKSNLKDQTKQVKEKLLSLKMGGPKQIKQSKSADKLNEIVNLGILENKKYADKVVEKLNPMIKQLFKENNINFDEIVKDVLPYAKKERDRVLKNLLDDLKLNDSQVAKITELMDAEFNKLTRQSRDKILNSFSAEKKLSKLDTATDKFSTMVNTGFLELEEATSKVANKLSNTTKQLLKENGINLNEFVRDTVKNRKLTTDKLMSKIKYNLNIPKQELDRIVNIIKKEFDSLAQDKRTSILTSMGKEAKAPTPRSAIEKLVEKINLGVYDETLDSTITNAVKEKYGLPYLNDDEVKTILDSMEQARILPDGREKNILVGKALQTIADKIPAKFSDKVKALRRVNLLLNSKTAINVVGNATFGAVENISNVIATPLDFAVSKLTGKRTASLPNLFTQAKGIGKGAAETIGDYKLGIDTSATMGGYDIPATRKIFKETTNNNTLISKAKSLIGKGANKVTNFSSLVLQFGDRPFYQAAYDDVLRQQMKGNKVKVATQEMKDIANQVALERTYQDVNTFTKSFEEIKRGLNFGAGFGVGDIAMPFTKTPANILKRAVEYTPLGLSKAIVEGVRLAKSGTFNQRAFVDSISRSVTGVGLIYLGYELAKQGVITGKYAKDKAVRYLEQQAGRLPYSIKNGNKYTTFDWATPSSIGIAIGSDLFFSSKDKKELDTTVWDAIMTGGETLLTQPLLQGMQKMFGSYNPIEGISKVALSAPTQFTPTVASQIAKTIDKKPKETYSPSIVERYLTNPIKARLGIGNLPDSVSTLGEDVTPYNYINTWFSPATTRNFEPKKVEKEILRIYDETGEITHFPRVADKKIEGIELSGKQFTEYQRILGQKTKIAIEAKMNNKNYKTYNNEKKIEELTNALSYAKKEAKNQMLEKLGNKPKVNIEIKNELIKKEMQKLSDIGFNQQLPPNVPDKISTGKKDPKGNKIIIKLTDSDKLKYSEYVSEELERKYKTIMNSPMYKKSDDKKKIELLKSAKSSASAIAKNKFLRFNKTK